MNTDASVDTLSRIAVEDGIARDHHGRQLWGCTKDVGVCPVLVSELWEAFEGLLIAWEKGD